MTVKVPHRGPRSYAATTMYVFSAYTAILSIALLAMATPLARVLDLHGDAVPLLRFGGFIIGCSTVYYLVAARHEFIPMMWATVATRALVPAVSAVAVVVDSASPALAVLAILDAAGGLWTWRALARSRPLRQGSSVVADTPLKPPWRTVRPR